MPEISEKPWSSYTAADYTLEQWHTACLIHLHDGVPTSKSECKLPVKTPTGTLSRAGVHAAASVLAGGRGGVDAPPEKIAAAKKSLMRLYAQLAEKSPESLKHYGVPGMKWGIRKRRGSRSRSSEPTDVVIKSRPGKKVEVSGGHNQPPSDDAKKAAAYRQKARASTVHSLSNVELQTLVTRMNLEAQYSKIVAQEAAQKGKGKKFIDNFLKTEGMPLLQGKRGPMTATGIAVIAAAKTASSGAKYAGKHRS